MFRKRIMLTGLKTNDYISPEESSMRLSGDMALVTKGLDLLNDLCVSLIRRLTLGRHIEITQETAPELHLIIKDICAILDYQPIPKVYVCHQPAQELFCAGTDCNQITFSDYLLEKFDEDMLYFAFGELIAMFKGGHTRLSTVCYLIPPIPEAAPLRLPLLAYLRAADLSSDRGGLLACQNFAAAAKCILWDAGIPMSEMSGKNEAEIIQLAQDYIDSVKAVSPELLGEIATSWKKWNMESMPHVYRLEKLLAWYYDGYDDIIAKWKHGDERTVGV